MLPTFFRPSSAFIDAYLHSLDDVSLSYDRPGFLSSGRKPRGFVEDHNRARLGSGRETFEMAKSAVRSWTMFDVGWTEVHPREAPIREGTNVAILARVLGLWTLNPARITETIEVSGPVERFGFVYGSLAGHSESGEEQFAVEWRHDDDSVWYDLHAFSRSGRWFSAMAHPVVRLVQKRFAADSMRAMTDGCRR